MVLLELILFFAFIYAIPIGLLLLWNNERP